MGSLPAQPRFLWRRSSFSPSAPPLQRRLRLTRRHGLGQSRFQIIAAKFPVSEERPAGSVSPRAPPAGQPLCGTASPPLTAKSRRRGGLLYFSLAEPSNVARGRAVRPGGATNITYRSWRTQVSPCVIPSAGSCVSARQGRAVCLSLFCQAVSLGRGECPRRGGQERLGRIEH